MLDFCLLHYLLSSDSEAMTLYKCHYSIHYFLETFNKKTKLVLYWIILKGNTSSFGSAIQVLPSDIGEYLSSFFNPVVVVVFIFILQLKNVFFSIVNSFVRKKVYLLTFRMNEQLWKFNKILWISQNPINLNRFKHYSCCLLSKGW